MMEEYLVGRCGLYCGACGIYRAERDRPKLQAWLAEHFGCKLEEVRCVGCNPEAPGCWCQDCKRAECLQGKGLESCAFCPDADPASCSLLAEMQEQYLDWGFDLAASLTLLRKAGPEDWLKCMKGLYTCPACGTKLTFNDKSCPTCKKEVIR
jgi:hypothetical protein